MILWRIGSVGSSFIFTLHEFEKFPRLMLGDGLRRVLVPWQGQVVGNRLDVGTQCAAYGHTDVSSHFPLFTVAAAVALNDCRDFPLTQLIEEGVALYSYFAYEQGVLLAGGKGFFTVWGFPLVRSGASTVP